ncbi:MAG: hypothetical protein ACFFCS_07505 [Candidatus Hodarchaeota archaeon]
MVHEIHSSIQATSLGSRDGDFFPTVLKKETARSNQTAKLAGSPAFLEIGTPYAKDLVWFLAFKFPHY